MKNFIVLVVTFFVSQLAISQALYRAFPSDVLGEERNVKILKPRNYAANPEKTYPLVIVLDGDFLFEPVAGTVDYLSYWDQMPESFVVGINQRESRYDETQINRESGFPEPQSLQFMDFVMEIRQTMMDEYRVAPFTVIVGKDITANLASFYLMRKKIPINAFIQIAPEYSTLIQENLINKISQLEEYNYFYVATPEKDNLQSELITKETDSLFDTKKNLHLKHETIKGSNKYTVAAHAIPRGLEFIFKEYQLIDEEKLLNEDLAEEVKFEGQENKKGMVRVIDRILEKYRMIKEVYGVDMKLRLVDLVTISNYVASKKDWDQLIDIGVLADKEYPDLLYGSFIEGLGYEGLGRPSRAIKAFNIAYGLEPAAGINKDDVLDKIELLQIKEKE
ncbi:esterase family protein [Nonlabens sp. Ci31]|uniref:alpha/beta hydrolase n=1 Tax=Nonlabens sp. Ci31 TaxID=2608253 RepID=UPI001463DB8B|nr:alpha/beta hydrolase-fold protein [Nonlabens sp. Ci31]QJP33972.1 esterase family protein [Nonlabens sp. Ci31]